MKSLDEMTLQELKDLREQWLKDNTEFLFELCDKVVGCWAVKITNLTHPGYTDRKEYKLELSYDGGTEGIIIIQIIEQGVYFKVSGSNIETIKSFRVKVTARDNAACNVIIAYSNPPEVTTNNGFVPGQWVNVLARWIDTEKLKARLEYEKLQDKERLQLLKEMMIFSKV